MKKYIKSAIIKVEEELVGRSCNACGKYFSKQVCPSVKELKIPGSGFFASSKYPDDQEIDVCESCLESWFKTFTFSPTVLRNKNDTPKEAIDLRTNKLVSIKGSYITSKDLSLDDFRNWHWELNSVSYDKHGKTFENYLFEHIDKIPKLGVYKSYDGFNHLIYENRLICLNSFIPMVLFQELFGDNRYLVMTLEEWNSEIKEDNYEGPRYNFIEV